MAKLSFFKSRKFKYGSVATGITVAFVAVVIIINIIFSLLADAYSWKLDMTSYDLYEMAPKTVEIVNALAKDTKIKITVVYSEEEYPDEFREIIKRFVNLSDTLECTYVDPVVNPNILKSFGEEYNITEGSVVVQSGDHVRVIAPGDMIEQNSETGAYRYNIQECLAAAVRYVTQEQVPLVYFVTDHGENGYESLMREIANTGADVEEIRLSQLDTIDEQACVMVICGPTKDFTEVEIGILDKFMLDDYNYERDMFFFSDPQAHDLPNLEGFLAEWGVALGDDVVLEIDANTASAFAQTSDTIPLYLLASYTGNTVSSVDVSVAASCIAPYSRSIELLDVNEGPEATVLVTTSSDSYAKDFKNINAGYHKADGDKAGPFNIAVVSTKYKYENNIAKESHVFVAGSVQMLGDYYMTQGNSVFMNNVYQMMLAEEGNGVENAVKDATSTYMALDTATVRWASIIFIAVIPGIFLVIGLIVFIRRRYL